MTSMPYSLNAYNREPFYAIYRKFCETLIDAVISKNSSVFSTAIVDRVGNVISEQKQEIAQVQAQDQNQFSTGGQSNQIDNANLGNSPMNGNSQNPNFYQNFNN